MTEHSWIDVTIAVHEGMAHWPGDVPYERQHDLALANGDVCNLSSMRCSVHTGTHMDAPKHFVHGAPGIDAMPLDASIGRARVIAITDRHSITRQEIEPHHLKPGERILFRTANSESDWGHEDFHEHFVYITPDAAAYIAECGVRTVGVDYLSVGGFPKETDGPGTHRALLSKGVWIIEGLRLTNIEPGEYELLCLPLKLVDSDGAPARALLRKAG